MNAIDRKRAGVKPIWNIIELRHCATSFGGKARATVTSDSAARPRLMGEISEEPSFIRPPTLLRAVLKARLSQVLLRSIE